MSAFWQWGQAVGRKWQWSIWVWESIALISLAQYRHIMLRWGHRFSWCCVNSLWGRGWWHSSQMIVLWIHLLAWLVSSPTVPSQLQSLWIYVHHVWSCEIVLWAYMSEKISLGAMGLWSMGQRFDEPLASMKHDLHANCPRAVWIGWFISRRHSGQVHLLGSESFSGGSFLNSMEEGRMPWAERFQKTWH